MSYIKIVIVAWRLSISRITLLLHPFLAVIIFSTFFLICLSLGREFCRLIHTVPKTVGVDFNDLAMASFTEDDRIELELLRDKEIDALVEEALFPEEER